MWRLFAVCLLVGCGKADPVAQCNDLLSQYCARAVDCGFSASMPSCLADLKTSLDCNRAVSVSKDYDTCLNQLATYSCGVLSNGTTLNIPQSCAATLTLK